jgi:cytochrome c-type biogenesis protein CcmE
LKKKAKFGVVVAIILVSLVWLGWVGVTESKTYYHTIEELAALSGPEADRRMRVAGHVVDGSIERLRGRVDFRIEAEGHELAVSYVGTAPLPDTFTDRAEALVEGKLMPDGRFVAEHVQAKCASKYEAAPGEGYGGTEAKGSSY